MRNDLENRINCKNLLSLFLIALSSMVFVGCAGTEVAKEREKRQSLERKISHLEEKLFQQKQEITALKGEVSFRQVSKTAIKDDFTTKSELASPIAPEPLIAPQEDTVADSTHETMHFYYEGTQEMNERNFDKAVKSFTQFLSESPEHVYADRAQFLIMESYFKNKEYGLALVASNLLETRFPHSVKLPEALYQRALIYLSLDQKTKSVQTLKSLIQNFPHSPVYSLASDKLSSLQPTQRKP